MLYFLTGTKYNGSCSMDGSTEARAAATAAGYTAVWFDETPAFHTRWVNTPAGEDSGEIVIELTLDEFKEVRGAELDYLTRQFDNELVNKEMFFTSSLGFSIDADLRSQNNLRGLQATGAEPVGFMGHDNALHSITQSDIATMLSECAQNGSGLYAQRWAYKARIAACTSIEELAALEFTFTMMDFSDAS